MNETVRLINLVGALVFWAFVTGSLGHLLALFFFESVLFKPKCDYLTSLCHSLRVEV
jgi:hypothetical protein